MPNLNRERGDRDEKRLADKYGGGTIGGSGSSAEKKGDIRLPRFLGQAKRSNRKSIAIKRIDLEKIQEQALNRGLWPIFFLSFYDGEDVETEWVAFPAWLLSQLEVHLDASKEE